MKHLLSTIHTIRLWIVLAVVFLFPILFLPITPDFYQTNKLYLMLVASLVLFGFFVIESLIEGKATLHVTNTIKGLGLLALVIVGTTLVGTPNIIEAFLSPVGVLLFISAFLFVLFSKITENDTEKIKVSFFLSLVVLAVVTIYHGVGITKSLVTAKVIQIPFLNDPNWSPAGAMQIALVLFVASLPLLLHSLLASQKKKGSEKMMAMVIPLVATVVIAIGALVAGYHAVIKTPLVNLSVPISIQVMTHAWGQTKAILAGTGLASYMNAFSSGKPATINGTPAWNTYFMQASGLFWHIGTTNGILGLAALLLAWIFPLLVFRKKDLSEYWGFLGSYLLLTVLMLFIPPALPFILLWVVLLLLMEPEQQGMNVTLNVAQHTAKIGFGLVAIALFLALGYLLSRSYAAYYSMYQSLAAVDRQDGTSAYQWAVKSLAQNPYSTSGHLYFSQINLELAKSLATRGNLTDEDKNTITSLITQSIREAKAAISMDPTNPVNWVNLGRIYETLIPIAQGADQWAVASYQQAAIYDPTNPQIRFALGAVSVTRKDYDGAINYFTQAAQLKPDLANAYYNLAYIYKLKGDVPTQTQLLQKTLTLVTKDSTDYTKVMNELTDIDRQKAASAAAQPSQAPPAGGPALTTPPSGKPIIVPPLPLPTGAK